MDVRADGQTLKPALLGRLGGVISFIHSFIHCLCYDIRQNADEITIYTTNGLVKQKLCVCVFLDILSFGVTTKISPV